MATLKRDGKTYKLARLPKGTRRPCQACALWSVDIACWALGGGPEGCASNPRKPIWRETFWSAFRRALTVELKGGDSLDLLRGEDHASVRYANQDDEDSEGQQMIDREIEGY